VARVQQLLKEWKPWLKGHGVVLTPHKDVDDTNPEDYDLAEIGAQGIGSLNGDLYPWVVGIDIEHERLQFGEAIRWMVDHVEPNGHIIIDLEYPRYKPSAIVDMLRLVWRDVWLVTVELQHGRALVVAREQVAPDKLEHTGPHFLLDNRPEIGDTFSLIPLARELTELFASCQISLRNDDHQLFKDFSNVTPYDPEVAYDGIVHQETGRNEFGDFLRRSLDFYDYPIELARTLGYLQNTGSLVELPQLAFDTEDKTVWHRVKTDLKKNVHPIVICTNTNFSLRDWPCSRWSYVINWLIEHGEQVLVVGKHKIPLNGLKSWGKRKYRDIRGKTTARQMAYAVSKAKFVVTPDTAVAHFAVSAGVPVAVLQGPTAGAPLFRYSDKVISVSRGDGGCVNCFQQCDPEKPYREGGQPGLYHCGVRGGTTPCMAAITVAQVTDLLSSVLGLPKDTVGISVCMLVKNEEAVIKECIEAAERVADEIVVVDTGSFDGTLDLIKEADAKGIVKIFHDDRTGFEKGQICDYAAARNGTFEKATMKYLIWLDAGDRLTEPEKLREQVLKEEADVIQMQTVFGEDTYYRERVVPRGLCMWKDRVHETIDIGELSCKAFPECQVLHVVTQKVGREGSLERNIRLLKRMIDESDDHNPRYGRWCYYLARELDHSGKREESVPYYEDAIRTCRFFEEKMHSLTNLARIRLDKRDCMGALMLAYDALKVADGWREPYYIAGDAYFWLGDYKKAILWYTHCANTPRPQTVLWVWEDLYTWLPHCQLAYCFERVGKLQEAVEYAKKDLELSPPEQKARALGHLKELMGKVGAK